MNYSEKVKFLENTISRFDLYIISTNNKASAIIAFNGILIGATFFKIGELVSLFTKYVCFQYGAFIVTSLIAIFSIISLVFAFRVVFPFLESGEKYGN
jgi:hypothetical protein